MEIQFKELCKQMVDVLMKNMDSFLLNYPDQKERFEACGLRDLYWYDFRNYFLYLANANGEISDEEIEFINEFFGGSITKEDVIALIKDEKISDPEFEQKLPTGIRLLLGMVYLNSSNHMEEIADAVLKLYDGLGKEFMACDQVITAREIDKFRIYNAMLREKFVEDHFLKKEDLPVRENSRKEDFAKKEDLAAKENSPEKENLPEAEKREEPEESLEELMAKLNNLIGLAEVKEEVTDMINLMQVRNIRKERGMKNSPMSYHMVFSGNPGTGKTTVARLLAKIYAKIKVLSKGQLIEVDRSGLVGGYVGQTAIKVQEVVKQAEGGILFIDEAYALALGGEADYGKEAINTLLKCMEDMRDNLVVIVAGYPDLMNTFLDANPGLRSRFNKHIFFSDYNSEELLAIFHSMCKEGGYELSQEADEYLKEHLDELLGREKSNFANGREVRNLYEKTLTKQAGRIMKLEKPTDEELAELVLEDILAAEK